MKRCWADWAKKAGVRAIKTVAQTAVATIGEPTQLPQHALIDKCISISSFIRFSSSIVHSYK